MLEKIKTVLVKHYRDGFYFSGLSPFLSYSPIDSIAAWDTPV
jgi:hypothetical protein